MNVLSADVALFRNGFDKNPPRNVPIAKILDDIEGRRWQEQIETLRSLPRDKYDKQKPALPAFCISGSAASRTTPLDHSGLVQVDLDKLAGKLDALRTKLTGDPHMAFVFVSPSGDGLKAGFRIPADFDTHKASFAAVERYMRAEHGVTIDTKPKDPLRLCFTSYDPRLFRNPAPKALSGEKEVAQSADSSEPLKDYEPEHLQHCNTT